MSEQITSKQIILLMFISRIVIAISFLPAFTSPPANQDVWIAIILAIPIELFLSGPIYLLSKRFPSQTLMQYSKTLLGKGSYLLGILYSCFFLHCTAMCVNQLCMFLTTAIMPETPFSFFAISLLIFSSYLVRKGIEVIARIAEVVTPIIMLILALIFILLLPDMEFKQLAPVMEKGLVPIFQGGLSFSVLTVEILFLAMLLPYLNHRNEIKRIFVLSFSLISLFSLMIILSILATFGTDLAQILNFPFFSATRLVSVEDFLERIEMVHVGIWVIGGLIKTSLLYYLTVISISQLLTFKEYKPFVLPMGTIILPLSFIVGTNILEVKEFISYKIFTVFGLIFIFIIPSALLLTAWVRKKGVR